MALQYKTRGMTPPQGKMRVYFSCHPSDFDQYFSLISEEILSRHNCAVWYDDCSEEAADEEALLNDLAQMQLFVMPITHRLLTTPNRAMDKEFPFAISRHIPVLPLMEESQQEELYQERIGDLQFLDRNAADTTAIPFEKKLDKYLSAVLLGEELTEKVRASFAAYIFLSYRKKDRSYAQALMRLIHQKRFCQDIAIWYDEFLTPGEDFNDAIEAAMKKSGIFAMVVTPNLVNEENYVLSTEYPMARREGMPILPVELVPTDRKNLEEKFADLPDCIDAGDEPALTDALKPLASGETGGDAKHNFYIGLAYLGGIDVEVDHDRAVKLITSAAEAGLPEAIEKLVNMYRSGEGVDRDMRIALSWQNTLCELCLQKYQDSLQNDRGKGHRRRKVTVSKGTKAKGLAALSALRDLHDYSYPLNDLETAQKAAHETIKICNVLQMRSSWWCCVAYNFLGNIAQNNGDMEKAAEWYRKARDGNAVRTIENRKHAPTVVTDLAISHIRMGDIYLEKSDRERAKGSYEAALKILERMERQVDTYQYESLRLNLADTHMHLGSICLEDGDKTAGKAHYEKAAALCAASAAETGDDLPKTRYAISCGILAQIYLGDDEYKTAEDYYEQAVSAAEQLEEKWGALHFNNELAESYDTLAELCTRRKDNAAATAWYIKSAARLENIVAKPEGAGKRELFAWTCYTLGETFSRENNPQQAVFYYEKAVAQYEILLDTAPSETIHKGLAAACYDLGLLKQDIALLERSRDLWHKLMTEYPQKQTYAAQHRQAVAAIRRMRLTGWIKKLFHR